MDDINLLRLQSKLCKIRKIQKIISGDQICIFSNTAAMSLLQKMCRSKELAEKYGTPLYIYSYNTLFRHFKAYDDAFGGYPHIICFALKANTNTAILRLFANSGCGADIVSGGELFMRIEGRHAAKKNSLCRSRKDRRGDPVCAEEQRFSCSMSNQRMRLREIDRVAGIMRTKAPIALRINPDIDPETHPYISTGHEKTQIRHSIEEAMEHYQLLRG